MEIGQSGVGHRTMAVFCALALGSLVLLCLAQRASADIEFCPPGTGAGQCVSAEVGGLRGLALDFETSRLYVADESNNRINVFEEDGDFLFAFGWGVDTGAAEAQTCTEASGCQAGIPGSGAGQFERPVSVAVDSIGASSSKHAIYVAERLNRRVQKFDPSGTFVWAVGKGVNKTTSGDLCTKASGNTCGAGEDSEAEGAEGGFSSFAGTNIFVGVGPEGAVYVLDQLPLGENRFKHRLQRFKDTGELIPSQCILFEGGRATGLAVEMGGNLWVGNEGEAPGIRKYDSACTKLVGPVGNDVDVSWIMLTLDEGGTLYAGQNEGKANLSGSFQVITAFDVSGKTLRRFGYGKLAFPSEGLVARNGGEGGIFVSVRDAGIKRLDFPPPGPTLPPPGPIIAPPSVEVAGLGSTEATVEAEINPEGKAPTTVHVEYLTQAEYVGQGESFTGLATKETDPVELSIPAGREFRLNGFEELIGCQNPAEEALEPENDCLIPKTTYRFRVVASNADGDGEGPVEGSFTTDSSLKLGEIYATGVGTDTARLHAEADPNSVPATGFFEYVEEAQFQQSGFATASKAPNVDEGEAPLNFGAGEDFTTRQVAAYPLKPDTTYRYRIVADNPLIEPEVSEAETFKTFAPPEVEPCPPNGPARIGAGAFLPDCRAYELVSPLDKGGGDIRVLLADLGRRAVLEQAADSGEKLAFGSVRSFGDAQSAPFTSQYIAHRIAGVEWQTHSINSPRERPIYEALQQLDIEFRAFSADLCETWQTTFAEPPLAPGALAEHSNLYRRTDQLCSGDGAAHYEPLAPIEVPEGVSPTGFQVELRGLSADGSHAIFKSNGKLAPEGSAGAIQLYESVDGTPPRLVCVLPGGEVVSASCTSGSNPGAGSKGIAEEKSISSDGERIFWSTPANGEGKVYVRIGGTQTVEVSKGAEEDASTSQAWFWGASADGSRAILSAGNLGAGTATLYSFELAGEETTPLVEDVMGVLGLSEDASRIYFASRKALAAGAEEGEPNLYLHEVGGDTEFVATLANPDLSQNLTIGGFFLHTARVAPDGMHAAFASVAPLTSYDNKGALGGTPTQEIYRYDAVGNELRCVSCNPSGARPAGRSTIPAFQTATQGARVLSGDGSRLFFESADALVARDSNGKVDVYQWEEEGTGGCGESDADFSAAAGGCVSLISSGQGSQDSRFVEATPGGGDAFFVTVSGLLPQDYGLFDVYDARVNGGLPIPPTPPPPCEGDSCHPAAAAPEPLAPASSDYLPPPGAAENKPTRKRCAKGKRRVSGKGKTRCVAKRKPKRGRSSR